MTMMIEATEVKVKKKRKTSAQIIYTREVLASIPDMVRAGMNSQEIADKIGSTRATLLVRCCQNDISLRRPVRPINNAARIAMERKNALRLRITADAVNAFNDKARQMRTTPVNIIHRLLELIIKDDLIDAILDGELEDAA